MGELAKCMMRARWEESQGTGVFYTKDSRPLKFFLVYDEIVRAVMTRGVTHVVIIGYSHGGGAVYQLSDRIGRNYNPFGAPELTDITTLFDIMTVYIDAVTQSFTGAENRRPPASDYHMNLYQRHVGFRGGPIDDPRPGDFEVNVNEQPLWGTDLTHYTIDDHPNVYEFIRTALDNRMPQ